jgi:hypothetical protein
MNALSVIHNLPETDTEVEAWVQKALAEIQSGEYDKQVIKRKLHFASIAFNMVRNRIK